jgi:hypothetical protein
MDTQIVVKEEMLEEKEVPYIDYFQIYLYFNISFIVLVNIGLLWFEKH